MPMSEFLNLEENDGQKESFRLRIRDGKKDYTDYLVDLNVMARVLRKRRQKGRVGEETEGQNQRLEDVLWDERGAMSQQ